VVTDVAIAKDVERMVAHAIETFGRLDYAVNNAGIEGKFAGITDLPEQEWDRVLDTNLKGTFLCLRYEARAMLAGGHGGAIVNVGSVNSFLGFHRLGVRRLETRANRADYERFRRVGTAGNPGQPGVSRIHRHADASTGTPHFGRRLVRQGSDTPCSYQARRPPG
jgi:NAD(P)-dependent dehydrogenase (short-subunit alcohol dehydrogenase family)